MINSTSTNDLYTLFNTTKNIAPEFYINFKFPFSNLNLTVYPEYPEADVFSESGGDSDNDHLLLESVRFYVQRLLVPPVTLIGLFGNFLTMVVMLQRRMSTSSTTHNYLAALAASDGLHLLADFILSLKHYPAFKCDQTTLQRVYWRAFPALIFFTDYTFNTAVWLTVCFTIERYIVIRFPIKGKVLCTTSRALKVILLTALVTFALTLPTFLENRSVLSERQPETESNSCSSTTSAEFYPITSTELATNNSLFTIIYPIFSTIAFTFVPIAILAIFNLFLIRSVRKSSQKRRRWIADQQKTIYNGNNNTLPKINKSPPSSPTAVSTITTGSLVCHISSPTPSSSPSSTKNSLHPLKPKSQSLIRIMTRTKIKWPTNVTSTTSQNSKKITSTFSKKSKTPLPPVTSSSSTIPPTCRLLLRQDAHITRLLIAVVLFFLVCLLPTALVTIYQAAIGDQLTRKQRIHLQMLGNVCNLLVSINSAGNFTLYCLLSRKYRRTLVDLVARLMKRKKK